MSGANARACQASRLRLQGQAKRRQGRLPVPVPGGPARGEASYPHPDGKVMVSSANTRRSGRMARLIHFFLSARRQVAFLLITEVVMTTVSAPL